MRAILRLLFSPRLDKFLLGLVLLLITLAVSYYETAEHQPASPDQSSYCVSSNDELSTRAQDAKIDGPHASVKPLDAPVRFMMYNVKNYFVAGERQRSKYVLHHKPIKAREAVADVIAQRDPDILGIVELGGEQALNDLKSRLAKRGVVYEYSFVLDRWGDDRALAVLSKLPIISNHSKDHVSLDGQSRRRLLRGLLDVDIQLPSGESLAIVGAHLKSRVADDPAAAANLRAREARTVAMMIHARMKESPSLPILLFGDWNDGPSDASLGVLTQGVSLNSALKRLQPADSQHQSWTHYYSYAHTYYVFDQMYVNSPFSRRFKITRMGVMDSPEVSKASDHRPIWVEFQ